MIRQKVSLKNSKYDKDNDVLHVFFSDLSNTLAEEEYPGVYLDKNDYNEVVGMTLMDFKQRIRKIRQWLPQYDFCI